MLGQLLAQGGGEITFTPNLTGFVSLGPGILIFLVPKALNSSWPCTSWWWA